MATRRFSEELRPKTCVRVAALVLVAALVAVRGEGQVSPGPDTVAVQNGSLTLRAMLWRPLGEGPFPAILFNHGSGRSRDELQRLGPYEGQAEALGPLFARHGYVFLYLFRQGVGLSPGSNSVDLMDSAFAAHGQDGRNDLQLRLLETREMSDALAGLAFLRGLREVDGRDVGVVGHSFGGSLTLLVAEHDSTLRAVVVFSGAGGSWQHSPQLRARLLAAVGHTTAPVFFIHAANDYSVAPGEALAAEMARLGRAERLKIYAPVGRTADDGHRFIYLGATTWEPDVFAFLDERMGR